jgi:transposase
VQLLVHARRFFCDAPGCPRRIFVEPFPGILAPYGRQTARWRRALLELAHASSAEVAARVAWLLGYRVSPDSLIRRQRAERFVVPSPRVLGVDEFALRRGLTYGTLLVDLEHRRPVAVLEGRTAEPLTVWLQAHPTVAILVRDRAGAYAVAGRRGAPDALQVADRFHLVRNVREALKALRHSRQWNHGLWHRRLWQARLSSHARCGSPPHASTPSRRLSTSGQSGTSPPPDRSGLGAGSPDGSQVPGR